MTHTLLPQRKGFHDGEWELRIHENSMPVPQPILPQIAIAGALGPDREPDPNYPVINPGDMATHQGPTQATLKVPTGKKAFQTTVEDTSDSNSQVHLASAEVPDDQEPLQVNVDAAAPNTAMNPIDSHPEVVSSDHNETEASGPSDDLSGIMRQEIVKRQAERNARAAKIAEDEKTFNKLEKAGRIPKVVPGQRLIGWKENSADGPSQFSKNSYSSKAKTEPVPTETAPPLTSDKQEAVEHEKKRKTERKECDQGRQDRNDEQAHGLGFYGKINWFWLSQTDIIPGFWATPWRSFSGLDNLTCSGAVTIISNALRGFTDGSSLRYVNVWRGLRGLAMDWMLDVKATFPGYAHNSRGGVVCSGDYPAVKIDVFKEMVPAIELFQSYDYQVKRNRRVDTQSCQDELLELMRLDAWLSICGRTDEIFHRRNDLIKRTAAMVQLVMVEFEYDFLNLDESDQEGGMQVNQALAASVMDFLLDEELAGAEQLYILLATLRAVKAGQCILDGQDTRVLQDMLREDVQVRMV
jgi:hypothetical protein